MINTILSLSLYAAITANLCLMVINVRNSARLRSTVLLGGSTGALRQRLQYISSNGPTIVSVNDSGMVFETGEETLFRLSI